jgi:conserved oligomeric Golgi complex subunit 7
MEWQDAAGLAQLSQSVEDVFSSGNLPKAAETLATMRHCLSAVGEVLYFICGLMHTVSLYA